ncbi:MAG: C1 family peptidase [Deltaproteobacteria bacterium]|nr:C1 family peptidase [Deltaproteobacteria bacterium]
MAKRHDQWPGQRYDWSSARGAMKGWHKNGVCSEAAWPWDPEDPGFLTAERQQDALAVRLGAYYRILPRRTDVHAALGEVGAVFASAAVHAGWQDPVGGIIPFDPAADEEGGHAFALVGYTEHGFLVQNSWGPDWGGFRSGKRRYRGVALWRYDDFDRNVWDLWVARLALPLEPESHPVSSKYTLSAGGTRLSTSGPPRHAIRDHYLHVDDGLYESQGDYPSGPREAEDILRRAVQGEAKGKPPAHLLLYAHGGLNDVKDAARRVARWRPVFDANDVHALHFIWETGLAEELRDLLVGKRPQVEARVGAASDWWDRVLERLTRPVGAALWREMQRDAERAFEAKDRAGSHALATLAGLLAAMPVKQRPRLHLVGHSAGSIWHAHALTRWAALGGPVIENLILFAPACTHALFDAAIRPALASGRVAALHHYLLDDATEAGDDVAKIYRKSLLYLVSNAYQRRDAVEPILGMAKFLDRLPAAGLEGRITHHVSPRDAAWTAARTHGAFDQDEATMNSMLALVLGRQPEPRFTASALS